MPVFEFMVVTTSVSKSGGPLVDLPYKTCVLEDAAIDYLEPVLAPYNQYPSLYFDKFNRCNFPDLWAMACLDHEYPIPGHIVTARPGGTEVSFVPYTQTPEPLTADYVPDVGTLTFDTKEALERAAPASPLFRMAWEALRDYPADRHWLATLGPLSTDWLAKVTRGDSKLWLDRGGYGNVIAREEREKLGRRLS